MIEDKIVHKLSGKLANLSIFSYKDLFLHLPIRYENYNSIPLVNAEMNVPVSITGLITGVIVKEKFLIVTIKDQLHLQLVFFHFFKNYKAIYKVGNNLHVYGKIVDNYGKLQIIHPKIIKHEITHLMPIYPLTSGLSNDALYTLMQTSLKNIHIQETIPAALLKKHLTLKEAIHTIHNLNDIKKLDSAIERIKLDELVAYQIMFSKIYVKHPAHSVETKKENLEKILESVPYQLTAGQMNALKEIIVDIAKPQRMDRLLYGDVGSGKTIVAIVSCILTIQNKLQACIVAPTELLTEQHYKNISVFCEKHSIKHVLFTSNTKQKKQIYQKIQSGDINLIIGTHAIFNKQLVFFNLGLVVIDEQHCFGVKQRSVIANKNKDGYYPHQLLMSATPIPRSLAMSYYAGLELSIINESPPNRIPVKTYLVNYDRRNELLDFIKQKLSQSCQVYWICPLIVENENINSTEDIFKELAGIFSNVAVIHGKMKQEEKHQIMNEFIAGNIKMLVATTLIGVGIDVPAATVMVVENSERFGLALLHQLRGRVARGVKGGDFILLYKREISDISKQRLSIIKTSNNGFEIAERDLKLRGHGELFGSNQSGSIDLKYASFADSKLIHMAAEIYKKLDKNSITTLLIVWEQNTENVYLV